MSQIFQEFSSFELNLSSDSSQAEFNLNDEGTKKFIQQRQQINLANKMSKVSVYQSSQKSLSRSASRDSQPKKIISIVMAQQKQIAKSFSRSKSNSSEKTNAQKSMGKMRKAINMLRVGSSFIKQVKIKTDERRQSINMIKNEKNIFLNDPTITSHVQKILQKQKERRTQSEHLILMKAFHKQNFFLRFLRKAYRLSIDQIECIIDKNYSKQLFDQYKQECVKNTKIFLSDLTNELSLKLFQQNEVVYRMGTVGRQIYILLHGDVRLDFTERVSIGQELGAEIFENSNKQYMNNLKCYSKASMAIINEDKIVKMMDEFLTLNDRRWIKFIKKIPYFQNWPQIAFNQIINSGYIMEARNNQVIYSINDPSDYVYMIQRGQVTLSTNRNIFNGITKTQNEYQQLNEQYFKQMNNANVNVIQFDELQIFGYHEQFMKLDSRVFKAQVTKDQTLLFRIPIEKFLYLISYYGNQQVLNQNFQKQKQFYDSIINIEQKDIQTNNKKRGCQDDPQIEELLDKEYDLDFKEVQTMVHQKFKTYNKKRLRQEVFKPSKKQNNDKSDKDNQILEEIEKEKEVINDFLLKQFKSDRKKLIMFKNMSLKNKRQDYGSKRVNDFNGFNDKIVKKALKKTYIQHQFQIDQIKAKNQQKYKRMMTDQKWFKTISCQMKANKSVQQKNSEQEIDYRQFYNNGQNEKEVNDKNDSTDSEKKKDEERKQAYQIFLKRVQSETANNHYTRSSYTMNYRKGSSCNLPRSQSQNRSDTNEYTQNLKDQKQEYIKSQKQKREKEKQQEKFNQKSMHIRNLSKEGLKLYKENKQTLENKMSKSLLLAKTNMGQILSKEQMDKFINLQTLRQNEKNFQKQEQKQQNKDDAFIKINRIRQNSSCFFINSNIKRAKQNVYDYSRKISHEKQTDNQQRQSQESPKMNETKSKRINEDEGQSLVSYLKKVI